MHVSAGSWSSVGKAIEKTAESINSFFYSIFDFLTNNETYNIVMNKIPDGVKSAIAAGALSILGLIFIINFLGKTLNLQWVTWENVLMLLLQLTIAKICIQNSEWIMSTVQKGFASMIQEIPTTTTTTIPDPLHPGNPDQTIEVEVPNPELAFIDSSTSIKAVHLEEDGNGGNLNGIDIDCEVYVPNAYLYFLDEYDAARAFRSYHCDEFPDFPHEVKVKAFDFSPIVALIGVFVNGLIIKAILAIVLIMLIARFMWLAVYTTAAPLSLATFAADETKDIGKSFIKSYVGVCLHAMVLLIILVSYSAVAASITSVPGIGGFIGLVKTFALGGMVMKSESVANKLCGAM